MHSIQCSGWRIGVFQVKGPRFAADIQHMKQFLHNWHCPAASAQIHVLTFPPYKIIHVIKKKFLLFYVLAFILFVFHCFFPSALIEFGVRVFIFHSFIPQCLDWIRCTWGTLCVVWLRFRSEPFCCVRCPICWPIPALFMETVDCNPCPLSTYGRHLP